MNNILKPNRMLFTPNNMYFTNIINQAFQYVVKTSITYNIDESHSLKHSMQTFNFAKEIYNAELIKSPELINHEDIIYISAILHDMCDKKYILNEKLSLFALKDFMSPYMPEEKLVVVCDIITKMSYSKVKQIGYPNLGQYQLAYHIVREADLLAAYDPDRCIIYSMMTQNCEYLVAVNRCIELFYNRVLKYISDGLFITDKGKELSAELHDKALIEIGSLGTFISN